MKSVTDKIDTRLSYSSANLILNCTQKYAHHKILNTPKDADIEDDQEAFNVGKAFHEALEVSKHANTTMRQISEACTNNKVEGQNKYMVAAMVIKYLELHTLSKLKCVATEFEISTEKVVGFVDAILSDKKGAWWIVDLKTAASVSENLGAKLHMDYQLNLYASFASDFAKKFNLDPNKFMGTRYRVTTKSRATKKETESGEDFVSRILPLIKSYDFIIPKDKMDPKKYRVYHESLHDLSMKLRKGELKPLKNFSHCESYFRPCEFWSQCYGATVSDLKNTLKVLKVE